MKSISHRLLPVLSGLMLSLFLMLAGATPGQSLDMSVAAWSADKRFIDHGDGTISDTRTGLMWAKKDSYLDTGRWMNWREVFSYVEDLNDTTFAGHIDWRMPTLEELRTLYEADKTNSSQVGSEMVIHIDPIFAKEGCGALWSSEANGHFNSFGVIFNTGTRFSANKKSRSRKATRAVRFIQNPDFRRKYLQQ
ncbi:DUF1566 domain-containing protein [Nitrospina sp. 32_T5]|uniref:Lcl C-terminal domain-containing protein n=1 Tax=unclassified Nitrospina TaxID=2638683 RepID=UPI003F9B61AE